MLKVYCDYFILKRSILILLLGMTSLDVTQIPEDDNWRYNMTRYDEPAVGHNMVCCVFVCNTWKAAGVFGELADSINCGELTNWDDVSLFFYCYNVYT